MRYPLLLLTPAPSASAARICGIQTHAGVKMSPGGLLGLPVVDLRDVLVEAAVETSETGGQAAAICWHRQCGVFGDRLGLSFPNPRHRGIQVACMVRVRRVRPSSMWGRWRLVACVVHWPGASRVRGRMWEASGGLVGSFLACTSSWVVCVGCVR